ncbi:MAG: hypothetical protein HC906_05660, partial [Bacteroidales bacterium]|nr:hypothetical protein [Bacteroidales bacterium]
MLRILLPFLFVCTSTIAQTINPKITVNISQASLLRVNAGGNVQIIDNEYITLGGDALVTGGTPSYLYLWKNELGEELSSEKITAVNTPGKYILMVTDIKHCTATDTLLVSTFTSLHKNFSEEIMKIYNDTKSNSLLISFNENSPFLKLS